MTSPQLRLAPAPASDGRVRVVTAAALFDGHDAAIHIVRRLLQAAGAEVVHLGHDRSVEEIATAAVHEDARAVAVSSAVANSRYSSGVTYASCRSAESTS